MVAANRCRAVSGNGFGTPTGYPDYLAHRFHEVVVVERTREREGMNDPDDQEPVYAEYKVRADDGWEGIVIEHELFPLTFGRVRSPYENPQNLTP
jgi:hypothetical protein